MHGAEGWLDINLHAVNGRATLVCRFNCSERSLSAAVLSSLMCGNGMSYSHQARVNITTFSGSVFQEREERNKGRNYKTWKWFRSNVHVEWVVTVVPYGQPWYQYHLCCRVASSMLINGGCYTNRKQYMKGALTSGPFCFVPTRMICCNSICKFALLMFCLHGASL